MISKKTIGIVAEGIAYHRFMTWCDELDKILGNAFGSSFKGERISTERQQRIFNRFVSGITEESKRFKYGNKPNS